MRGVLAMVAFQEPALTRLPLIRPAATFSPPPRKGEGEPLAPLW